MMVRREPALTRSGSSCMGPLAGPGRFACPRPGSAEGHPLPRRSLAFHRSRPHVGCNPWGTAATRRFDGASLSPRPRSRSPQDLRTAGDRTWVLERSRSPSRRACSARVKASFGSVSSVRAHPQMPCFILGVVLPYLKESRRPDPVRLVRAAGRPTRRRGPSERPGQVIRGSMRHLALLALCACHRSEPSRPGGTSDPPTGTPPPDDPPPSETSLPPVRRFPREIRARATSRSRSTAPPSATRSRPGSTATTAPTSTGGARI